MFKVGDKIVYPMHGAGTIDSIEEKEILGEKQQYYVINMPGEVKIMVPTAKAQSMGVRSVVDKKTWMDLPIRYQKYRFWKEKMLRIFLR